MLVAHRGPEWRRMFRNLLQGEKGRTCRKSKSFLGSQSISFFLTCSSFFSWAPARVQYVCIRNNKVWGFWTFLAELVAFAERTAVRCGGWVMIFPRAQQNSFERNKLLSDLKLTNWDDWIRTCYIIHMWYVTSTRYVCCAISSKLYSLKECNPRQLTQKMTFWFDINSHFFCFPQAELVSLLIFYSKKSWKTINVEFM